jgi:hypothetical protein
LLQSQQQVSINSTSYKGGGLNNSSLSEGSKFPLIPLPIKEAVPNYLGDKLCAYLQHQFPLIPLPIKEAVWNDEDGVEYPLSSVVSINSTSYKGSGYYNRTFLEGEFQGYDVSINSTSYKGSGQPRILPEELHTIVSINSTSYKGSGLDPSGKLVFVEEFPLIPLPIKEAVPAV